MSATSQVNDAYQALLADLRKTAMEERKGVVAEITYRDDSERIHILRIRSDASGALIWFDGQGGEIPEPQFKTSYIDVIATRLQIMEDAKSQLHNAVENLGSIRNAKGQYVI